MLFFFLRVREVNKTKNKLHFYTKLQFSFFIIGKLFKIFHFYFEGKTKKIWISENLKRKKQWYQLQGKRIHLVPNSLLLNAVVAIIFLHLPLLISPPLPPPTNLHSTPKKLELRRQVDEQLYLCFGRFLSRNCFLAWNFAFGRGKKRYGGGGGSVKGVGWSCEKDFNL